VLLARRVVLISLTLFAAQAALLVAGFYENVFSIFPTVLRLALSALVAFVCFRAAQRAGRFGRQFWLLISLAFCIWLAGGLIVAYFEEILHAPMAQWWPSAIFFYLFSAPIVAALLLDERSETTTIKWERTLDLAQVAILAITAFLVFFYVPSLSQTSGEALSGRALKLHLYRDTFLTTAFALRGAFSRSRAARVLYSRMALFLLLYGATSVLYFYGRGNWQLPTGLLDLIASAPLVVLVLLAATWTPVQQETWKPPKPKFRMDTAWVQILSWMFPFLILSMAPRIPFDLIVVCIISAFASLICAVSRIGVTVRNQKKTMADLQASEERFSKAFHASPIPMAILRARDKKLVDVNDAMLSMGGDFTRDEVIGSNGVELGVWVHPEQRVIIVQRIEQYGSVSDVEWEFRRKDGEIRSGLVFGSMVELEGEPCILWIAQDITERKRAEEALRASEERFSKAFHASPVAMAITELGEGKLLDVNNAWLRQSGYTRGEVIGRTSVDLNLWVHPADRSKLVERMEQVGAVEGVEIAVRKKSGVLSIGLISAEAIELEGKPCILWVTQDITRQKEAGEKLRASEERFSKAFNSSPIPMTILRLRDKTLVDVNEAMVRLTGYQRTEGLGSSSVELGAWVHPEERAVILSRLERGEPVRDVEMEYRNKSGEKRFALIAVEKIELEGEACLLWVAQDITDRKQAEEMLRASEERFSKAFRSSPAPMTIIRLSDAKIIDVNNALLRQGGYTREEVFGKGVFDLGIWVNPEERAMVVERLKKEGTVQGLEIPLRRKTGEVRTAMASAELIELGGDPCILWAFLDVTSLKETAEKLRISEERFSKAFRLSPHAMTISRHLDGRYLDVNERWVQWANISREQMIGHTSVELGIWSEKERAAYLAELNRAGFVRNWEVTFHLRTTGPFIGLLSSELIELNGEKCIISAIQDITERKKLEEQLRQSQKMEAVGLLAGGVAHDFNNLLGVILGYADLIAEQVASQRELCEEVEQIRNAAERAASLTKQLLAFSRRQLLKPIVLDLNGVVSETERLLGRLIGEHIVLVTKLEPALGRVKADRAQIEQVIMNLAVNARDAMPLGGTLTIETANVVLDAEYAREHIGAHPGRYVMLAMSDTGVGMDNETQARVFEPFFTTKDPGKGTGLGLATVYGIVKQSEGSIWLYSEIGRGTTFKIYLPEVDDPLESATARVRATPQAKGTEVILLVEDEDALRNLVFDYLRRTGYAVLAARNAQEAMERCRGTHINLLLTDVVLPGVSGPELAREVREMHPTAKVLFVSGYTDGAMAQHGLLEHGAKLLHKPFRMPELGRMIRDVLDAQKA
jgi:PAS domain S-box-containing protein